MHYKGVIHMHSTHSYDGKMSLSELKQLLMSQGISFACMTEHTDTLTPEKAQAFVSECRDLSDDQFVFVPGFEVPYQNAHILHIGATECISQTADVEQLKQWREVTPFVVLAHPVRNKFAVDQAMLDVIDGIEVWNQQYEGKKVPRVRSLKLLQALETKKVGLLATGGLDLHRKEHYGAPVTTLVAEALSTEKIIQALQTGAYTFGNEQVVLASFGTFKVGTKNAIVVPSALSVGIIVFGKTVNKVLAMCGISLPKALREKIRSRV